jgi:hypothetical protein
VDLDSALNRFERVNTNLERLESVHDQLWALIPAGIEFGSSPEARQYRELCGAFADIAAALPPVDGFRITSMPLELEEIAQARLDANEISEPEILINLGREMDAPVAEMDEYRRRFSATRRRLIRERLQQLIEEIEVLLGPYQHPPETTDELQEWADGFDWEALRTNMPRRVASYRAPRLGDAWATWCGIFRSRSLWISETSLCSIGPPSAPA